MPRRKAAPKRDILPDPLFKSALLAKFINVLMLHGKKSVAEKIIYGALDIALRRSKPKAEEGGDEGEGGTGTGSASLDIRTSALARERALDLFKESIESIKPVVEVKSRRVGGSTYQVPVEIRANRQLALAMRWLVEHASKRNEKTMMMRLANEILDSLAGRGGAVKKREDVHRMAKANQAYAHYRW